MARSTDVKAVPRPAPRPAREAVVRRMPAVVERVAGYLREIWVELHRVDWPSRRDLVRMTVVVVVVLLFMAAYLGAFDWAYTILVKRWLLPQPPR